MWYTLIAFGHPWILTALGVLPVIWWLLRAIPPAPRAARFPAIRLLQGLPQTAQSPERTPWWLLALRLVIAALIIVGLARPLTNASVSSPDGGLLIMVVDDGWASGPQWSARRWSLEDLLTQAGRREQEVLLLTTAREEANSGSPMIQTADATRAMVVRLQPKPWRLDRRAALKRLADVPLSRAQVSHVTSVWLSDGLDVQQDTAGAVALVEALRKMGPVTVLQEPPDKDVLALL